MHGPTARRRLTLLAAAIAVTTGVSLRLVAKQAPALDRKLYAELTWRCTGPFNGGPVKSVSGVAGMPGVYIISTPTGSVWETRDGGGTWTADSQPMPPGFSPGSQWTDRTNPKRMVRTDASGIEVSLDGGGTWVTSHNLPIAEVEHLDRHERPVETKAPRIIAGAAVNVSIADPAKPTLIFAGTNDAVYVSFDSGARWSSLRQNMPAVAITDLDIRGHDLVAATRGRSTWVLEDISPLRQINDTIASAPAVLFKPADATQPSTVFLDYYVGAAARDVSIEVADAAGRVVRTWRSGAAATGDTWLPVTRPLAATPGHHRVTWTLRFDAPPSPHHRFAQLARPLFESLPPDPDGPRVLPGTYRVRLNVGGRTTTQSITVRGASGTVASADERAEFDLEMKAYDAMQIAHRGFLQLKTLRDRVKPLVASADSDLAAAAGDLDTKLAGIDGSDWTGLVIPDIDEDNQAELEEEAKEGKHPNFVPPKAVSISKDYDDPTSVLGRNFTNVDPPAAFAIVGTRLGEIIERVDRAAAAPDALAIGNYDVSCQRLAAVLDTWRAINTSDVSRLNVELRKRKLTPLAVVATVPTIACAAKRP